MSWPAGPASVLELSRDVYMSSHSHCDLLGKPYGRFRRPWKVLDDQFDVEDDGDDGDDDGDENDEEDGEYDDDAVWRQYLPSWADRSAIRGAFGPS